MPEDMDQKQQSSSASESRRGCPVGRRRLVIVEDCIPSWGHGPEPQLASHEAACLLNAGAEDAQVEITVYFENRVPGGPYRLRVPAGRTHHARFHELDYPEPIPGNTGYASVMESDVPIVVQHTRLDSRQAENALLSTIAYASDE